MSILLDGEESTLEFVDLSDHEVKSNLIAPSNICAKVIATFLETV